MTIDLEKLKAAAIVATHGEWKIVDINSPQPYVVAEHGKKWDNPTICNFYDDVTPDDSVTFGNWYDQHENATANASFIAIANPDTILELIERLEVAEKQRDELESAIRMEETISFRRQMQEYAAHRDELLAALLLASCCLEPNTSTATVNQIEAAIASVKEQEK